MFNRLIQNLFLKLDKGRMNEIVREIKPFLKISDTILDIGSGGCDVCGELISEGYSITPIDIKNKSLFPGIKPKIFNGENIPFQNNEFDASLLITVFHHTKNPTNLLKEAMRVSNKIIVIEDLYKGRLQKYLTFIMDSMVNFEFFHHPHSNKTKVEWEDLFKELGLEIVKIKTHDFWIFFTSGTFYLQRS